MKKFDWDHYVPLGIDGQRVRNYVLAALIGAVAWSLIFWFHYTDAYWDLFQYRSGTYSNAEHAGLIFSMNSNYILKENAVMKPFSELLGGVFWGFALAAAAMLLEAVRFYSSHYQGSKSIYTMKRLPSPWELHRRCLTVPIAAVVACGLLALLLLGVYYAAYLYCTPAGCLP